MESNKYNSYDFYKNLLQFVLFNLNKLQKRDIHYSCPNNCKSNWKIDSTQFINVPKRKLSSETNIVIATIGLSSSLKAKSLAESRITCDNI